MPDGKRRLEGKVAIVTGGASGIGRTTAQRFAAEGAIVVVADIQEGPAGETASALSRQGATAIGLGCDVADEGHVRRLIERVTSTYKRIDILANVAGIWIPRTSIEEVTLDRLNRILSVNV